MSSIGADNNNFRHGHAVNGILSPTYRSWYAAKTRCTNPNQSQWKDYGGRGVTMCDRWANSFVAFLEEMGERPSGKTLDRIEGSKGYEPGNCRWADRKTQNRNSRRVVLTDDKKAQIYQLKGTCSQPQISKLIGVSVSTVNRVVRGTSWA